MRAQYAQRNRVLIGASLRKFLFFVSDLKGRFFKHSKIELRKDRTFRSTLKKFKLVFTNT